MKSLTFSEGNGRLLRSEHAIVFAKEPSDDLFALFADDRSVDFKSVASIIVANNFEMPAFAVIAIDSARLFVFGNLDVQLGDERLSGSGNDTWVEREVDLSEAIMTRDNGEVRGNLRLGWVAAGSFHFGPDETAAPKDEVAAEQLHGHDSELGDGSNHGQQATSDKDESPNSEAIPPTPVGTAAPVVLTDEIESDSSSTDGTHIESDQWDPLADPNVDLERIGEQAVVDTSPPPAPPSAPLPPQPADPELAAESSDDMSTDDLYAPEDTRDTRTPPPPQRPSIPPPPPTPAGITPPPSYTASDIPPPPDAQASTKALPTIPAPPEFQPPTLQRSAKGNIRFDDGQSATVDAGVYVGRHPTKNGLPDNYSSVTIRGEHVSRLHFELAIDGAGTVVRDLGSNSGTEVEINGRRITVPDGGMQISPGAKIIFADRWAIYETE